MRTTKELFDLSGKTALVTGGSRGLGLQIAEALGEQGAKLVLTSRKQADLDEAVAHLKQRGIEATAIAADLSQEANVAPLVQEAMKRLGHIDILINNAGATWGAPAEDYPLEAWDKVMNLNVRSIFLISQAVAKASMLPRNYGKIVNVASIAGLSGNGPNSMQTIAYNTSKGAVVNFTRTLAGEWGKFGITVNALAPGFFPSKMTKGVLENFGADTLAKRAPLQRIGDDEDLKGAALLFSSDASKHITGQILAVDGGVSAVH
ncbi:glucose 1-dehydrogenase [Oxalobacteraceae bacterium OM1]|nr:glucose 1-dehydrogenase [Oxalobacteraceae bacterium OM1]